MSEMERRMVKTDAIRFCTNWRQYLKNGDMEKAEGFFMGGWMSNSDDWCVNVLHQLELDELHIIIEYPMWM